ncbi:MAG TPA: glycoside hydrolase family 27 protein [Terriglobia bacterium]|nr:glycoside hydrolase family 27 protein [Terriglobia bacterium]
MKAFFTQFLFRILAGAFIVLAVLAPARSGAAQIARTPPMGWNTWYAFGCKTSDAIVRAQVQALISDGLKAAGYQYINLDDCWQGSRDGSGNIHPNSNFPDMKALATYVHAKGLKFGIYSSPGPKTCGGFEGSYGHERQDAETYARWGVDFLKYDWCSAARVYTPDQMQFAYRKMGVALRETHRPIVYSLCQYGLEQVWTWGASVGGNLWRTTMDVSNRIDFQEYARMAFVGFGQTGLEHFAGPGRWNDPDMLQIGNRGLNEDEDKTQMSLWCLMAAPLMISSDLTKLTPAQLAILTNREVISVDQDRAGIQGSRISQEGPAEVWMKPLANGAKAVGLFNLGEGPMTVKADFGDLGIKGAVDIRDLWAQKDLGRHEGSFSAVVPRHGVMLVLIRAL